MEKNFVDRLEEARSENKIAHVCVFNNGKSTKVEKRTAKRIMDATDQQEYWAIEDVLFNTAKSQILVSDFDTMELKLLLGIIYEKRVLDNIKGNLRTIPGIVRYYTGGLTSYSNGIPTKIGSELCPPARQGYIDYNMLLESVKASGLEFMGPQTFQEFEECILRGEPFDIKIVATLASKKKPEVTPTTK